MADKTINDAMLAINKYDSAAVPLKTNEIR